MAINSNPKITNILKNISELKKEDFKILSESGFSIQPPPHTTLSDIGILINDTIRVLDSLSNSEELINSLNGNILTNLDTQITNFISQFKQIASLKPNELTNQHHPCINQLVALNNTLRQSGIYSILTPSMSIPKLEEQINNLKIDAAKLVKEAQGNADLIRNLIPEATATSLSVALDEIANKLRIRVNIWLSTVILILIISASLSWYFLITNDIKENYQDKKDNYTLATTNNLDTLKNQNPIYKTNSHLNQGGLTTQENNSFVYWLKRIIVFLPIFYLIIFSIKQYNKERKLLEIYVHKKAIAQTLPAYMKQGVKSEVADEILLRGSTMIFTLPENPESQIKGSDGISLEDIKTVLDIKGKLQN